MEMRIWVLLVGVEMWKVTLSKSEMSWSIEVGVALESEVRYHCAVDCAISVISVVAHSAAKRSLSSDSMSTF
jgi:hypothetical protein